MARLLGALFPRPIEKPFGYAFSVAKTSHVLGDLTPGGWHRAGVFLCRLRGVAGPLWSGPSGYVTTNQGRGPVRRADPPPFRLFLLALVSTNRGAFRAWKSKLPGTLTKPYFQVTGSVAVSTSEGTFARWRITSTVQALQTTLTGPQRPLQQLEDTRHARDAILDAIDLLALAARREGATYAEIGRALGISRQAARQAAVAVELDRQRRDEDQTWRMPTPVPRPQTQDQRPGRNARTPSRRPVTTGRFPDGHDVHGGTTAGQDDPRDGRSRAGASARCG